MTKAAFAVWESRIAPVFDVVRRIHLVEVEAGKIIRESEETIEGVLPVQKVIGLRELGVDTLICGSISRFFHEMVTASGIQVVSFITGELCEVVQAWLSGTLGADVFIMPGYCRRGRRHPVAMGGCKEGIIMNGKRGGGMGQRGGGGRGQGRGGQTAGRRGGMLAAGAGGFCVCPQCGKREPHQQGVPCFERKCPDCGTNMIRERTGNA